MLPNLDGKTVLITGGTGSFGKAFSEFVLKRWKVNKLIIFSRDELKQSEMSQSLTFGPYLKNLRFFIGDVRDRRRLEMAFSGVDYVVHAAALKQIMAAEYNPFECIRTNVHGAENVVDAAIRAKVKYVVALSTDKAANPANLYGASKLASDKIFVAAKWLVGATNTPTFSVVRYGNVIGSRGSVVPFFRKIIDEGADRLPITDPRMTRFWITLEQGIKMVLDAFSMMQGGEIFVPKIPSLKVLDLARLMAPDLEIEHAGIRPGEKLHETMITVEEARSALELPTMYVIRPSIYDETHQYHVEEKEVEEGFFYSSDSNTQWLEDGELTKMIDDLGMLSKQTSV